MIDPRYLREISPPASQPFFGDSPLGCCQAGELPRRSRERGCESKKHRGLRFTGKEAWRMGRKRRGGKGWRKFLLEVSSKIYGISEIFLHKGMQFLVHLEMKIAGSVALCTPSGIWNFPGYQEKGRTCWRDLELMHKHVWVHWV